MYTKLFKNGLENTITNCKIQIIVRKILWYRLLITKTAVNIKTSLFYINYYISSLNTI